MILLIDTSSSTLRVGLADSDGKVLTESSKTATAEQRGVHDAWLAVEVDRLLKEQRITPQDIHQISLVSGPGSFTGLRIGFAFVKGLMLAINGKLSLHSTHELIRLEAGDESLTVVTEGYQKDLVYFSEPGGTVELRKRDEADRRRSGGTRDEGGSEAIQKPGDSPDLRLKTHNLELSLSSLGGAAAKTTQFFAGSEVADLEPLYVTEFTVSSGSKAPPAA